jgi:hypothetical protein
LRNILRIIIETELRVYKELMPMKKEHPDLENAVAWIPDSKTPNGVAGVPLTPIAVEAFRSQLRLSLLSPYLFSSDENANGRQRNLKTVWSATLRRAEVPHFRICDSPMQRGSVPAVLPMSGPRICCGGAMPRSSRSIPDEAADEARGSGKVESDSQRAERE